MISHQLPAKPVGLTDSTEILRLLALSDSYVKRPGELTSDLDSALAIADRAEQLSVASKYFRGQGLGYLSSADAYREMRQYQKEGDFSRRAIDILRIYGTPEDMGHAYANLASSCLDTAGKFSEKIRLYKIAADIFGKAGDVQHQAEMKQIVGDLYQVNGDYPQALRELGEVIELYKSVGFQALQGVYDLIGAVNSETGDYVQALKYGLMAVKIGEQQKDTGKIMSAIYNRVGITYFRLHNYDMALPYFTKAWDIASRFKSISDLQFIGVNIADMLSKTGQYQLSIERLNSLVSTYPFTTPTDQVLVNNIFLNNYTALKDWDNAEVYYQKLLLIYGNKEGEKPYKQWMRFPIIRYLQARGQYTKTYPYLAAYRQNFTMTGDVPRASQLEFLTFRSDSATGHLSSALRHYQAYKKLSDSLFNIDKAKQLEQLQLQYETEKKDQDIKLLTQQSRLQTRSLQRELMTKDVIAVALVLLLLLLGSVYNRYRLKKRSNKILQIKQIEINRQNVLLKKIVGEKEWLLKEVHHRVKNNLQIVISLLNTQSAYLQNEDALLAIQNSQHRMHSMSLIHQRLYQSGSFSDIDMHWYIHELVKYMRECLCADERIGFKINVEKIELDVAQAVPIGLILNEAINNAIKYAFPGGKRGKIEVEFRRLDEELIALTIKDTGIGLPYGWNLQSSESLGMSLIQGLSEQLGGTLNMENKEGVQIQITFALQRVPEIKEGELNGIE